MTENLNSEEQDNLLRSSENRWWWILLIALLILTVQIVVGVAVYYLLPTWTERGQFGDVFGSVNATFSGMAFAGLIYAILLQREDLSLQREELRLTRVELKRSANAQVLSEVALRAQAEATTQQASLATISFLIGHYQKKIREYPAISFPVGDPRQKVRNDLNLKVLLLNNLLSAKYEQLIKEKNDEQT